MADVDNEDLWLERRAGDLVFLPEELVGLPPFNAVKSPKLKGQLEDKPNSVVVRRYREGDVIIRQGSAGGTAYYILKRAELVQYRDVLNQSDEGENDSDHKAAIHGAIQDMSSVINNWDQSLKKTDGKVARAHLFVPDTQAVKKVSWLGKLAGQIWGGPAGTDRSTQEEHPEFIPIDGPRDLNYKSRSDHLTEGELFGEMSCMNRMPRSATVVALRDCYVVEILRTIFEVMLKDANYKSERDEDYRRRYLKLHLRGTPLMRELPEDRLVKVENDTRVQLPQYPPGTLIVDQNDRADGMYLIRSGVVKVILNASFLLAPEEIVKPLSLARELASAVPEPKPEIVEIASLFTPEQQEVLRVLGSDPEASSAVLDRKVLDSWGQASDPLRALWNFLPVADAERYRNEISNRKTPDASGLLDCALKPFLAAALNELIKRDRLRALPSVRAAGRENKVGLRVWRLLADPDQQSPATMRLAMRKLLSKVFDKLPGLPKDPDVGFDARFRVEEFLKVTAPRSGPAARVAVAPKKPGPTSQQVSARLSPAAQEALNALGASPDPSKLAELAEGLNELLEDAFLLGSKVLLENNPDYFKELEKFLPGGRSWLPYDTDQASRADHRLSIEPILKEWIAPKPAALPQTVNYLSDRDFLGEIAVLRGIPRKATCVTYSHPGGDPSEVGPVRLVFLPQDLIEELLGDKTSSAFRSHLEQTAKYRLQTPTTLRRPVTRPTRIPLPTLDSPAADRLGLVQGRALMLVNLDRCTRCDQCVEACIQSHDDGRSRLYLDGPRFGRFLVPATCRSCLDPVCTASCPVGSIWKSDHGEVVIKDWCIGCKACAEACPYGAIQMHGIAWRFMPEAKVVNRDWYLSDETDQNWPAGQNPFKLDRDFRIALEKQEYRAIPGSDGNAAVCFRYRFPEHRYPLDLKARYRINLTTLDPQITLWLNDGLIFDELIFDELVSKKRDGVVNDPDPSKIKIEANAFPKDAKTPWEILIIIPGSRLRAVGNLLAARVRPSGDGGQSFLDVKKWEVAEEDKPDPRFEPKRVYQLTAVVCDLCSSLPGGPACVSQCPHDAAIRIDVPNEIIPGRAGL